MYFLYETDHADSYNNLTGSCVPIKFEYFVKITQVTKQ